MKQIKVAVHKIMPIGPDWHKTLKKKTDLS
jgi:hypothetical protein